MSRAPRTAGESYRTGHMGKAFIRGLMLLVLLLGLLPRAESADWVPVTGKVLFGDTPLCAMVLANGQNMFSCSGDGSFNLSVPLDKNGQVTLFTFAQGFAPYRQTLSPAQVANINVDMFREPESRTLSVNYSTSDSQRPGWVVVEGSTDSSGTPVCALMLANGQTMFSCNETLGRFTLEVPLDKRGQVTLFAFVSGFQPFTVVSVAITDPSDPGYGAVVTVPPDALGPEEQVHITINSTNSLPGAIAPDVHQASRVFEFEKDSTYNFKTPVSIKIPLNYSELGPDDVPVVFYWDELNGKYLPTTVTEIDRNEGTITFRTTHFSVFTALIVPGIIKISQLFPIDSGFRPSNDGFFLNNFGTPLSGGFCLGMSLYSQWYFNNKKNDDGEGLFFKHREGEFCERDDDIVARELISRVGLAAAEFWSVAFRKLDERVELLTPFDTAIVLLTALHVTKEPQTLEFSGTTSAGKFWAHAVTVYRWNAKNQNFEIYDNNFPCDLENPQCDNNPICDLVTLNWSSQLGFNTYSKASAYAGSLSEPENFAFEGMGSVLDASQFEPFYQGAENDWTNFGRINLLEPHTDSANVAVVTSSDEVKIHGSVDSGFGPIYWVSLYLDNEMIGIAPISEETNKFTFTIPNLPSSSNTLYVVATNGSRLTWDPFTVFAEVTLNVVPDIVSPANVTASAGDGQATISWDDVSNATSYNIYWGTTPPVTKTTGTKIEGLLNSSYVHTGLDNGTNYYYVVTAVNDYGESEESDTNGLVATPRSILNDRVLMLSEREGNWEIYSVVLDGSSQTNLTNNQDEDRLPSLFPDRSQIAFVSDRDGNNEIYVMTSDGANPTRLTNNTADDATPIWSPDGKKIAFVSERDGNREIYVMDADGGNQLRLTNTSADEIFPSWSPDSKRITFVSERDGNEEIYIMNADGTGVVVNLTNNSASDNIPFFSPEGAWISFVSDRDGSYDLWIMDTNGSNLRKITTATNNNVGWYSWSPDGTQIAFDSSTDGDYEVYVINFDGTNLRPLTLNSATDQFASWTWDGNKIVFISDRDGKNQIYAMDPDGGNPVNISNDTSAVALPMLSPVYQTGGGCFIATAAYGSYLEPEVMVLRELRDKYLLTNDAGKAFTRYYYKWSPPVANLIARNDSLRMPVRIILTPLIYAAKYPTSSSFLFVLMLFAYINYFRIRKKGNAAKENTITRV